jgi:hypothetical protein
MTAAPHRFPAKSLALLVIAMIASPSLAGDWHQVAVDDASNRYLVDRDRISRQAGTVKAYVRTEYAQPREREDVDRPIFAVIDRLAVRCAERAFALESRSVVTSDGEEILVLASSRDDLEFRAVVEGSASAAIVRHLCAPPALP